MEEALPLLETKRERSNRLTRESRKRFRLANLEEVRRRDRELYAKKRATKRKQKKDKYAADPRAMRSRVLKWRLGITLEEKEAMIAAQNQLCALCGLPLSEQIHRFGPHVDHDKLTGKIRGILHHHCNTAIGLLRDDPEMCKKAAEYLTRHQSPKS